MPTGTPLAKQSTKELKGKTGKSCILQLQRNEPGGRSFKKTSESQKAKALWAMKAAWDRGEECHNPARKEDILRGVGMPGTYFSALALGS